MVAVARAVGGTVTIWPSPVTMTLTVLVLPSSVSVTVQLEPAWMPVNVFDVRAGDPGGDVEGPDGAVVAAHGDADRALAARRGAGDVLCDHERPRHLRIGVSQVSRGAAVGGDGDGLGAPYGRPRSPC